jgi:hypothetical protein
MQRAVYSSDAWPGIIFPILRKVIRKLRERGKPLRIRMRKTHKQLKRGGWLRQIVADGPLANEVAEIYDLLGYEVHLQAPRQTHSPKRSSTSLGESKGQCQTVYIRSKK